MRQVSSGQTRMSATAQLQTFRPCVMLGHDQHASYFSRIDRNSDGQLASSKSGSKVSLCRCCIFFELTCRFMTGDVIFDAAGFREDLRSRFDTKNGLTVYHTSDVPAKCVAKALKAARQAGFHDVKDEIGAVHVRLP